MFERFSAPARAAVAATQELARAWHTERVGTAHLLAGAVRADGPQGSVAARALAGLGVEPDTVVQAAAQTARPDATEAGAGAHDATWTVPLDADALARLGIDLDEVRERTDAMFGPGALDRAGQITGRRAPSRTPFDAPAKKMLEIALREAIHAGHKQIDTGHLLLAALRLDQTDAHRVLLGLGLDPADVRADVTRTWAEDRDDPPAATAVSA